MSVDLDPELWLRNFIRSPGAPARLVCLPHSGGSATYFLPVARALAPALDVAAVQYPGRQDRRAEPCATTVDELADALAEVVVAHDDRPVALFGHSLGATVAFEVARRLEAAGVVPTALFVSGRRAPSLSRPERTHTLADEALIAHVRALGGTESNLLADDDVVNMVLPALRSDYRAAETYVYVSGAPLSCRVVALLGKDDPMVTASAAAAWRGHTTGPFELSTYPGGHFYLNDHVPELVALVAARLGAATQV